MAAIRSTWCPRVIGLLPLNPRPIPMAMGKEDPRIFSRRCYRNEEPELLDGAGGDPRMNSARSVRRAALGDEGVLRELRLQALREAPLAFGSTYERELARTTADWQRWMSPGVTFILCEPAGARGMVAGLRDEIDPAVVNLMAMWVHPESRGSGAADELVIAVIHWAQSEHAKCVRLK